MAQRTLGFLEILYTPSAMILAQAVIATPIVTGITVASTQNLPANLKLQVQALAYSVNYLLTVIQLRERPR